MGLFCFLIHVLYHLQFDRYDQVNGRISEYDFAYLVLSYSTMNDQRRKKYYKRIKKVYGNELSDCPEAKVWKGGQMRGNPVGHIISNTSE